MGPNFHGIITPSIYMSNEDDKLYGNRIIRYQLIICDCLYNNHHKDEDWLRIK